jgi:hypothetical protein
MGTLYMAGAGSLYKVDMLGRGFTGREAACTMPPFLMAGMRFLVAGAIVHVRPG